MIHIKKESCNGYLQGSFLIFSRNFMEAFPEGLYDGTFMYGEELILYYLLKRKRNVRIVLSRYTGNSL